MNRIFKFRAWIKKEYDQCGGFMLYNPDNESTDYFMVSNGAEFSVVFDDEWLDKNAYEIMQFTGLTDMNAKEIFEGDILNHDGIMLEIKYSDNHAKFTAGRDTLTKDYGIYSFVAGNIHENPELICLGCQNNHGGPSHKGSKRCESGSIASGGKNAHCTCDVCF